MHQKITELRPSRWATGAKKKGPKAMPANAAEFYTACQDIHWSKNEDKSWSAYSIGLLDPCFAIDLGLLGQVQLAR